MYCWFPFEKLLLSKCVIVGSLSPYILVIFKILFTTHNVQIMEIYILKNLTGEDNCVLYFPHS